MQPAERPSRRARRMITVATVLVALGAGGSGPPARASTPAPLVYATGAQSSNGWTVPVFAVPQGASVLFANADIARHDFVSLETGSDAQPWCILFDPGACPLFFSAFAGLGQTVAVEGLDALEPTRTYTFICLIHPLMRGTLVALPPIPPP